MIKTFPQRILDPIAAGGNAVIPGMPQQDGIGKALLFDAIQEQRRKKEKEEQVAQQKFENEVKAILDRQKTAWQQDIPAISQKINEWTKSYADYMSRGIDPLNAAKNPEAFTDFYSKAQDIQGSLAASQQDKLFYDIAEKKVMEPNYNNQENRERLERYRQGKPFERQTFRLKYNFDEPKFLKEVGSAVKTVEDVVVKTKNGVQETLKTTLPDPKSLAEMTLATMTKSTGPEPEEFRNGVIEDVKTMGQPELIENALFYEELARGGTLSKEERASLTEQLKQEENKQALYANATIGRAAVKIGSTISTKEDISTKTDPNWFINNMRKANGGDGQSRTTFGIVTKNALDNFPNWNGDLQSFLKKATEGNGVLAGDGNSAILRLPTSANAITLPGAMVQSGINRFDENTTAYGTFTQYEMVMGYKDPQGNVIVLTQKDIERHGKNAPTVKQAQPFVRAKFNPATPSKTIQKVDSYGLTVTAPNPEYQKLIDKGIDPTKINIGASVGGQANYAYFQVNSDTDRNLLNSLMYGGTTTTPYTGQTKTESNQPQFMINLQDF